MMIMRRRRRRRRRIPVRAEDAAHRADAPTNGK
jgi:hypothetical protein